MTDGKKEEIDDIVGDIMENDGLERQVDGHEILTDFRMMLFGNRSPAGDAYATAISEEREEACAVRDGYL